MLLSVVIPTHDRRHLLLEVLAALGRQTLSVADFEVIVVCDGCSDGTAEHLRGLPVPFHLRVLDLPRRGAAAARNSGVGCATAPVVVLLDDDVVATPGLLAEHVRLHAAEAGSVVIGRLLAPADRTLAGWTRWEHRTFDRRYDALASGSAPVPGADLYTGNVSFDRAAFLGVGGFDTRYRRSEDRELGLRLERAGATFAFGSAAAGEHRGVRTYATWRRAQYDDGRATVRMARDQGTWSTLTAAWCDRHLLTRVVCRAVIERSAWRAPGLVLARMAARLGDVARLRGLSLAAYSAIANVDLWQGVADELGDPRELWSLVQARGGD